MWIDQTKRGGGRQVAYMCYYNHRLMLTNSCMDRKAWSKGLPECADKNADR